MKGELIRGDFPPNDGREWDAQCARCGSSCFYDHCWHCGGKGGCEDEIDDLGFDTMFSRCPECSGSGGFYYCISGKEWCEQHPIEGREKVLWGEIEWFTFDEPKRVGV